MNGTKNQTIYIRKSAQATLRELSEKTRLSQSVLVAEWLGSVQEVLDSLPDSYRLTVASYPNLKVKPRKSETWVAPIFAGEMEQPINTPDSTVDKMVAIDCELMMTKQPELKLNKKKKAVKK